MEKFIEVYDDIFPPILVEEIEKLTMNTGFNYWYVPNVTSINKSVSLPGFSHPFFQGNTITSEFSFLSQILYFFCFQKKIIINKITNARAFLTLPTLTSTEPLHIHTDDIDPHWVCLYYVNDSDGDTIFYDSDNNEIKRVSPKKGRIIFFDGMNLHTGSYPTQNPRCILNFNFIGTRT